MSGCSPTGLGDRREVLAEPGEVGDALVDVDVLGGHDHGQLRGVGLDERLHELVLVMVVQVQQVEQVGDAGEHGVEPIGVADVEPTGLDRRVVHCVADALVDLAVEVVAVGDAGFDEGRFGGDGVVVGCGKQC